MWGVNASGGGFLDDLNKLAARLERLERICSLFVAPLAPLDVKIKWTSLQAYLDKRVDAPSPQRRWDRDSTCVYVYNPLGIRCDFSQVHYRDGDGDDVQDELREALLTVAACEGKMPMRLLEEIQPGAVGAVDLLADVGKAPGE